MSKTIGRFDPTPSRTPEECERHYTQVHVRMAQDFLRPMPSVQSYHIDRAVAQADASGGSWGEEALGRIAADGSLLDPALADVNLLEMEELAALDKTAECGYTAR